MKEKPKEKPGQRGIVPNISTYCSLTRIVVLDCWISDFASVKTQSVGRARGSLFIV